MIMNFEKVREILTREALSAGLEEYEIYFTESSQLSTETLKDEISSFSSGNGAGVSFRCIVHGHVGVAATELFDEEELKSLVRRAMDNAAVIENDDLAIIYGGAEEYGKTTMPAFDMPTSGEIKDTAVVTSYSYTADSRIIDIVRDMYDAYQEDGFDVIFLGSRYALRDYPDLGWHYAYTSPKYWRYVQQHSLTTVTLVDSEGNVVVNPLTEDIDDVLEVMESVFGPVGGQIHPPLQGVAKTLQKASVGNGIDIVFLGDAFTAEMIAAGIYDRAVSTAVEHIFADRTLRGLRDRFNIYSVSLPSRDGDYFSGASTVLGCWYGEDSKVGGDDELCRSYTASVVTEDKIDDALTIVLMNSERYGGTTYMYSPEDGGYGSGYAVAPEYANGVSRKMQHLQ